jgi:hypothetical protein
MHNKLAFKLQHIGKNGLLSMAYYKNNTSRRNLVQGLLHQFSGSSLLMASLSATSMRVLQLGEFYRLGLGGS